MIKKRIKMVCAVFSFTYEKCFAKCTSFVQFLCNCTLSAVTLLNLSLDAKLIEKEESNGHERKKKLYANMEKHCKLT